MELFAQANDSLIEAWRKNNIRTKSEKQHDQPVKSNEQQKSDVYYENPNTGKYVDPNYNPYKTKKSTEIYLRPKNNYDLIIGLSSFNTPLSLKGGGEFAWFEGKGNILDPRKKDGTLMIGAVAYYGNFSSRYENKETGQYNSEVTEFGIGPIVNRNNVTTDMNSWTGSLLIIHSKIKGQIGAYNREQVNNDFLVNMCLTPSAKSADKTSMVRYEISGYYRGNITRSLSSRYDTSQIKDDHLVDTRAWGVVGTVVVLKQNLGGFLILSKKYELEIPLSLGYDFQNEGKLERLVLGAAAWVNYQGNQFIQLTAKALMHLTSTSQDNVILILEAKANLLSFLNRF